MAYYISSTGIERTAGENVCTESGERSSLSITLGKELFISNMPSLVGSLALAWASLGVDWFKVRGIWLCHYVENMFYCVKLTCVT